MPVTPKLPRLSTDVHIRVDREVAARLAKEARGYETRNDTLRRLLGLPWRSHVPPTPTHAHDPRR